MKKHNKVNIKYYPSANRVHIGTVSKNIYPGYAKYLFEYLGIPQNATIVFTDRTIKGGVIEWLKEI